MTKRQVSEVLHNYAEERGADEEEFRKLGNSVEDFTKALLDPLKFDDETRSEFYKSVDVVLEKAIECKQKKVGRAKF